MSFTHSAFPANPKHILTRMSRNHSALRISLLWGWKYGVWLWSSPPMQASCSGDVVREVRAGLTFAPYSRRSRTHSELPAEQASHRGVLPSTFLASTCKTAQKHSIFKYNIVWWLSVYSQHKIISPSSTVYPKNPFTCLHDGHYNLVQIGTRPHFDDVTSEEHLCSPVQWFTEETFVILH